HPVADVEHPPPGDAVQVDGEVTKAVVDVVVDHRGQQVVGCRHGVEIAGEVEVQPLHGHDLAVSATRRAALDPEGRAHRGLADGDGRALADLAQRVAQADSGRGLAFAQRRGGDGGDDHVLGPGPVTQLVDRGQLDLRDVVPVGLEQVRADAHLGGDVLHGHEL